MMSPSEAALVTPSPDRMETRPPVLGMSTAIKRTPVLSVAALKLMPAALADINIVPARTAEATAVGLGCMFAGWCMSMML